MFQPELHWVRDVDPSRLALMPRPRGGEWLEAEVAGWRRAGVDTVVSLLESHEVRELQLQTQAALCETAGIDFLQHPIADRGVPSSDTRHGAFVRDLHARLLRGQAIAIHCRAGIGRTGLVAGCVLHLLGVPGRDIFRLLSRSRGVPMPDTLAQEEWVERFIRGQRR